MLTRLEQFTAIAILLGLAVFFRVPQVTKEWPVPFCNEVQLTSALAARNLWLTHYKKNLTADESKWLELKVGRFVEPPLLQHLTAITYAIVGEEVPWVSGIFSSLFWLIGGFFLFRIARRAVGDQLGAITALAFYLLAPYSILLSMSFQPEALLVLGFLISIDSLLSNPFQTWNSAIRVSLTCGVWALAKPGLSLIPVFALCFAVNSWQRNERFYKNAKQLLFYFFVPLPSIAYVVWYKLRSPLSLFSITDDEFLAGHLTLDYLNHLTLLPTIPSYIVIVVGLAAFGFSLWSTLLWGGNLQRRVYFGLLAGYLGNVIFFVHALGDYKSYGILPSYYHWPLIPLTAVGLGVGVKNLFACINWRQLGISYRIIFATIALRAVVVLPLGAMNQASTASIPNPTLYPLINRFVPRGERALVFSDFMAQDVRLHSWLQTQSWSQEMEFLKLGTEEKYVEMELKMRGIVEKTATRYLILVMSGKRPPTLVLEKRLRYLPKVLSTSSLVIYDVSSWIPKPEMKIGALLRREKSVSL